MQLKTLTAATLICLISLAIAQAASSTDAQKPKVLDSSSLKEDFYSLDKNGDGYVDAHELRMSMPGILEDDITAFFDRYDADRDGVLSLEEYLAVNVEAH